MVILNDIWRSVISKFHLEIIKTGKEFICNSEAQREGISPQMTEVSVYKEV